MNASTAAVPVRSASPATLLRAVLVGGCVASAGAVFLLPDGNATANDDAQLALLLHGMAAIKSLLVVAAVALLAWRFGHPIARRHVIGYLIGAWLVCAATAAIWRLTAIVPAALAFHVGGLLLLVIAWRDDGARLPSRGPRTTASRTRR